MTDDLTHRLRELQSRRDELRERLDRIKRDYRRGLDRDLEEQAQELENSEVLNEIARVTSEELGRIEQGIQRLEQALRQRGHTQQ